MKHTISGHLYWRHSRWMDKPEISFHMYDMRDWEEQHKDGHVHIQEHSFEVDVPDNFDPRPQQIAALQAEQSKVRAAMSARIKELQDQINSLMAIEMTEGA